LKVALHAGRIQLAWPSWAGDAQLFETTNLVWPARWTLATNSAQAGLVYWQVELAPGGAARFFQLHQP
jgi:hypothetical protein